MTERVTVHAVGITAHHLLMQQGQARAAWRIRRVALDDTTVNMCSPLYEHDVTLVDDGAAYRVTHWHGAQWRVTGDPGRCVRLLVRRSFFPLLRQGAPSATLLEHWAWEAGRDRLSVAYVEAFEPEAWTDYQSKTGTSNEFWDMVRDEYAAQIELVLKALQLRVEGQGLDWLWRDLGAWRQPQLALYFRRRLREMPQLVRCAARHYVEPLRLGPLSSEAVRDLARLYTHMEQVAARQEPNTQYHDVSTLLRRTLGPARLCELMKRDVPQPDAGQRTALLRLLVHCAVQECEAHAARQSDTCWPLTLKAALGYSYGRLLGCEPNDEAMRALLPFDADAQEPTTEDVPLDLRHFGQFVAMLCAAVVGRWDTPTRRCLERLHAPLLIVRCKPEEWQRQLDCHALWSAWTAKHVQLLLPPFAASWDVGEWRREYAEMDPVTRTLWDARFVLAHFSVAECGAARDLQQVEALLHSEFFTTSLVCPARLRQSRCRLEGHLRGHAELTPRRLQEHWHDVGDEKGARDTVVALDCHLWSQDELLRLLRWARQAVTQLLTTRLVLLSCDDVVPLSCDGHAALDLAQWCDAQAVSARVFQSTLLCDATDALLQQCCARVHLVPHLKDLAPTLQRLQGDCARLTLHLLEMPTSWKRRATVHPLQDLVDAQLSLKVCNALGIAVDTVPLDKLWEQDWATSTVHVFLSSAGTLRQLRRNALHHVFLGLQQWPLCVLQHDVDKKLDAQLQWLRGRVAKQSAPPNLRYTLPYWQRAMRRNRDADMDDNGEQ